jgi:hypothetical protein
MKITKEPKDMAWFIDTVLIRDVENVAKQGGEYLSFSLMTQGLETLGALLDSHPMEIEGQSSARFTSAVDRWMPVCYHPFNNLGRNDPHYLYGGLRCGMAHIMRPQKRIMLKGSSPHYSNLEKVTFGGNDYLIVVVEDFLRDYLAACRQAKADLPGLPKGSDFHLTIYTVEEDDPEGGYTISTTLSSDDIPQIQTFLTGQYSP